LDSPVSKLSSDVADERGSFAKLRTAFANAPALCEEPAVVR